jgi:hypothetical protein
VISRRRAMILSGLVLPGLGQWVRQQRVKAVIFAGGALVPIVAMFIRIYHLVHAAMFVPGSDFPIIPDENLLRQIHLQAWTQNWWLLLIIAVFWIASVADAGRSE